MRIFAAAHKDSPLKIRHSQIVRDQRYLSKWRPQALAFCFHKVPERVSLTFELQFKTSCHKAFVEWMLFTGIFQSTIH